MKELTTQTGIIVKCSKTAIEFFQNAQSVDFFSALEIPKEFQDIAVEFYDLILENDHPTALLGCRGNYRPVQAGYFSAAVLGVLPGSDRELVGNLCRDGSRIAPDDG